MYGMRSSMSGSDYIPSNKTVLTLRQWGLSQGKIKDLLSGYRSTKALHFDGGFLAYCHIGLDSPVSTMFPDQWKPSKSFSSPVPENVYPYYLTTFQSLHEGRISPASDLEAYFYKYLINCWELDCRNHLTERATVMRNDWEPSQECIGLLVDEGLDLDYIMLLKLEFRLYWFERGEKRINWNQKFKTNAIWRFNRKKRHNLAY